MMSLLTTLLLVGPAAMGFSGHHRRPAAVGCCDVCGVGSAEVAGLIREMQCHPKWRKRDNAAHDLREFDWRCHPEAAQALAAAMLCDPEEEVREEAAESLAKMKPCLPEVHAALARASRCDPDHATRKWARRGLEAVGERCVAQCGVCGVDPALPAQYVVPVPAGSIREVVPVVPYEPPLAPPVEEIMPPSELPPGPEAESPFLAPAASRRSDNRAAVERRKAPAPRLTLGRFLRGGSR